MYVLLISASLVWGINVLVMKVILQQVPIYFLATLKVGFSLLSVYAILKIKKCEIGKINYKEAFKISLFALTINFIFTFMGMGKISGTGNAIMNALAPLITIVLSFLFLHKRIEKKQWLAMSLAIVGFLWSIHFSFKNISIGHLLLLTGMISYCFANVLMQKSRNATNYLPFTFSYLLLGFIELCVITLCVDIPAIMNMGHVSIWLWILFVVFSGIGFAFIQVVYLYALKSLGSVKTSFFLSLNPVFTYLGSLLFLHEDFNLSLGIAFGLMVIALIIANIKTSPKKS